MDFDDNISDAQQVVVFNDNSDNIDTVIESAGEYQGGEVIKFPSETNPSKTIEVTLVGDQKTTFDSNGKLVIIDHNFD